MRNPLDMTISFASHQGLSIDKAIEITANKRNTLKGDGVSTYQHIGTWSDHVTSWVNEKRFPVLILRYEDMLENPEKTFSSVVSHINFPENAERLDKSIRFSSFKTLQTQEAITGFSENPNTQKSFFRKGQTGQWKEALTDTQITRIVENHGAIMKVFNYQV